MTRVEQATRRREIKAAKRFLAVLAGGWGQEAALGAVDGLGDRDPPHKSGRRAKAFTVALWRHETSKPSSSIASNPTRLLTPRN